MKKILFILLGIFSVLLSLAQEVYQPLTSSVYDYIDEMANLGHIEINSAIKPYSRNLISKKLLKIKAHEDELNKRQLEELNFYLKDFNKEIFKIKGDFNKRYDLYYYGDSLFQITINPILGDRIFYNNNEPSNRNWDGVDTPHRIVKADAFHRWSGASLFGAIGSHFGFAASLRDNGISQDLYSSNLLVNHQGGNYKINQGVTGERFDFSEVYGAITYSWNWGSVAVRKDNFEWGNNYNGANILSARQPSFAYLNFKMNPTKWFDFNYMHGWLVSQEIDSAATYWVNGQRRRIFYDKYIATNLFTFKPLKHTHLSFGNSIIYSDVGINPGYLIPFMFFKSIDHTYNGTGANDIGQNSQLFFDVSTRALKYTHFYISWFIDEVNIGTALDKNLHTNLFSTKAGVRVSNLLPNTWFTFEYTKTNPWTYQHQIARTTYASNYYNLGHYLQDNARELYASIIFKPIRPLKLKASYTKATKGPQTSYYLVNGSPNVKGLKFQETIDWSSQIIALKATYEVIHDGTIHVELVKSQTTGLTENYTPELYRGNTTTVILGLNYGF